MNKLSYHSLNDMRKEGEEGWSFCVTNTSSFRQRIVKRGGGGQKYPNLCDVIYECPLGALGIGHSHPACKINIGEMCLIINTTG